MEEYIIVTDIATPISDYVVTVLAKQGWLVSSAADPDAISRQVDKHGAPTLLICTECKPTPEIERMFSALRQIGKTHILAVIDIGDGPITDEVLWMHADDLIIWPVSEAELVLRVRRLLRNAVAALRAEPPANLSAVAGVPGLYADADPARVRPSNAESKYRLSNIERKILRQLEEAQGDAVSIEQLADFVTAPSLDARISAVRVHINRLRSKVEENPNRPRYIVTVRGVGYRLGL